MKVPVIVFLLLPVAIGLFIPLLLTSLWMADLSNRSSAAVGEAFAVARQSLANGRTAHRQSDGVGETSNFTVVSTIDTLADTIVNDIQQEIHLKFLDQVVSSIRSRISAAERVVILFAATFDAGRLTTCDISRGLNFSAEFVNMFCEAATAFPSYFHYLWFDEPIPDHPEQWLDCGWQDFTEFDLYIMGHAEQRYHYFHCADVHLAKFPFLDEPFAYIPNPYPSLDYPPTVSFEMTFFADTLNGTVFPTEMLLYVQHTVFRDNAFAGAFGADVQMNFLRELLSTDLTPDISIVFIMDALHGNILSHSNPDIPLFPTPDNAAETPHPYTYLTIPDDRIKNITREIFDRFGDFSLFDNATFGMTVDTLPHIVSFHMMRYRTLTWLVCKATDRNAYFGDVEVALWELSAVLNVESTVLQEKLGLSASLLAAMRTTDETVAQIGRIQDDIDVVFVRNIVIFVFIAIGIMLLFGFHAFYLITRPIRNLVHEMEKAGSMDIDHPVMMTSYMAEMDKIAENFAWMQSQLIEYKSFMPRALFPTPRKADSCHRSASFAINSIDVNPFRMASTQVFSDEEEGFPSARRSRGGFEFCTIMAVNRLGTHKSSHLTSVFSDVGRVIEELAIIVLTCTPESVPLLFSGDRILLVFDKTDHAVTAVRGALALQAASERIDARLAIGIASGRVLTGRMGCLGVKTFNVLGPPAHFSLLLMKFCVKAKTTILVNEEVMQKARYRFQFWPVAPLTDRFGGKWICFQPGKELSTTIDAADEWMYALQRMKDGLEVDLDMVLIALREWQKGDVPSNLHLIERFAKSESGLVGLRFLTSLLKDPRPVDFEYGWSRDVQTTSGPGPSGSGAQQLNPLPGSSGRPLRPTIVHNVSSVCE